LRGKTSLFAKVLRLFRLCQLDVLRQFLA